VQEFKFQNLPDQSGVVETDYSVCTVKPCYYEMLVTSIHSHCSPAQNGPPTYDGKSGSKPLDREYLPVNHNILIVDRNGRRLQTIFGSSD
jgi:hypothetical protein